MEFFLRNEIEQDYNLVEHITREAFWDLYAPGCVEHLIIHKLRNTKEFVKELDFVAVFNNQVVASIVYAQTRIINSDKTYSVLTFGPISVLPAYQHKGFGSKLINHTKILAKEMGYKAIIIYGDSKYYSRFGFKESKHYNITDKTGNSHPALLVLELYPNALNGIAGMFDEGENYNTNEAELAEFEKRFTKKEKGIPKHAIEKD